MRQLKKTILLICLIGLLTPFGFAQEVSTQGKEFWLSFISNGFKYHPDVPSTGWVRVQLLVSAKRSCEGTITNPNTGWTQNFVVEANNIFSIDLDETQVYIENSEYEQVVNKGLQITTTDTVSVYCANIATYSFDASYVLPTQGLADDYIIQTHEQSNGSYDPTSAFVIVATEDNTTIDITPSVKTLGGKAAHEEFTITLNKGQAYQVRSHKDTFGGSRDLSGTRVTARDCKCIAVFNGNNLTLVPNSAVSDSDCIFEQAMPLHSWGKKFVVTSSLDRNEDYVKITSASDNNEIRKNGELLCTLNTSESYAFRLSSSQRSCYLEASQSCAVYLYNTSSNGSGNGAPSMLWIAPIEQRIDDITFSTFNYVHNNVNISRHYVNVIVESQDVGQVYLDGELLSSNQFEAVAGNEAYSFYRKQITHGVHRLSCPNGINAHVYGFGDARGYAYMVGSKAADLSTTLTIDNEIVSHNDTVVNCTMSPMHFEASVNYSNFGILWDLGDGTTSTEADFVHTYPGQDIYEVTFTITTQENPCLGTSSTTTVFYIDTRSDADQEFSDEICFKGPETYTENGFNLYFDQPGQYTDSYTIIGENGCISTATLNLTVGELTDEDVEVESGHCDAFEWHGNTYTEPGQYTDTTVNETGCYSVYHLDLELSYTPNPTDIYPADTANPAPHWVSTATEFQINDYDFKLWDLNPACQWDTVLWSIENDEALWVLEPSGYKGRNCKVYVLNRVNDTVWLTAKVFNGCDPENGIERRYWLISSFYGIDDNLSSGSGTFDFEVLPNPNNGQMALSFHNMSGKIDLKVYDMHGKLIDRFQIFSSTVDFTLPYQSKTTTEGLYLFVATGENAILTKKVIISR